MERGGSSSSSSRWLWEEEKLFENCLAELSNNSPNRWEIIAAWLGTKSAAEVEQHYADLVADVEAIEAGLIEPPEYRIMESPTTLSLKASVQRRPARSWTDDEHRLFLSGLEIYGKGDWKSISRFVVQSRSPSQIASHAQKYFERRQKEEHDKKRPSIFDN